MWIFLHTLPAFGALGCWSRKFHNLDFPTIEMLHAKNSNNWLCSFKDAKYVKLLTQNGQRTTQVDAQRPIAIGVTQVTLKRYAKSCKLNYTIASKDMILLQPLHDIKVEHFS